MSSSKILKIILVLVGLLIIAGVIYYFLFNPSTQYNKLIRNADEMFENRRFDEAKSLYSDALTIKTDETWPRKQISIIDSVSRHIEIQIRYDEKIQKADALYTQGSYLEASEYYFEAINIAPNEDYPINQIKKIQALMKDPSYKETSGQPLVQTKPQNKSGNKQTATIKTTQPPTTQPMPASRPANTNAQRFPDGKYYHIILGVFADHSKAVRLNEQMIADGRTSRIIFRPGNMEAVTFDSYKDVNTAYNFLEFVKNDINRNAWVLYLEAN